MTKNNASMVSEHRLSFDGDTSMQNDELHGQTVENDCQNTMVSPAQANSLDPKKRWLAMLLLTVLVVVVDFGANGIAAPLVGVYEDKLCAELRSQSGSTLGDDICDRNPMIEREVALLRGTSQLLESIPVILLSTFYGSLADRCSRRLVLSLGLLGLFLYYAWVAFIAGLAPRVSLRLVWIGPFFMTIGGGVGVILAMIFACIADLVTPENRVSTFSFVSAVAYLSAMAGSFASSLMMERVGNYIPLVAGVVLMGVGSLPAIFLPDTRSSPMGEPHADQERDLTPLLPKPAKDTPELGKPLSFLHRVTVAFRSVWATAGAIPMLVAGFCFYLGDPSALLVFQYMPYRFGIALAKANMFMVLNMGICTVVLLALLPLASTLLVRWGMTSFRKDMLLTYISGFLCLTGSLIVAIAPKLAVSVIGMSSQSASSSWLTIIGLVLVASGIGTAPLVRSILLDIFPSDEAAFAVSLISVFKTLADSLRGPLYSALYTLSLRWDNILMGLPFFGGALVYVTALCCLVQIKRPVRLQERAMD